MTRVAIVPVLLVVALRIAALLQRRRRTDAPTQPAWSVPVQLDRNDFTSPEFPWLVVLFSSATCDTCSAMADKIRVLASPHVAVEVAEIAQRPDLHRRYAIDAVPTTVVAGTDGVVVAHWVGPVSATDLWAGVAAARGGTDLPDCGSG